MWGTPPISWINLEEKETRPSEPCLLWYYPEFGWIWVTWLCLVNNKTCSGWSYLQEPNTQGGSRDGTSQPKRIFSSPTAGPGLRGRGRSWVAPMVPVPQGGFVPALRALGCCRAEPWSCAWGWCAREIVWRQIQSWIHRAPPHTLVKRSFLK